MHAWCTLSSLDDDDNDNNNNNNNLRPVLKARLLICLSYDVHYVDSDAFIPSVGLNPPKKEFRKLQELLFRWLMTLFRGRNTSPSDMSRSDTDVVTLCIRVTVRSGDSLPAGTKHRSLSAKESSRPGVREELAMPRYTACNCVQYNHRDFTGNKQEIMCFGRLLYCKICGLQHYMSSAAAHPSGKLWKKRKLQPLYE